MTVLEHAATERVAASATVATLASGDPARVDTPHSAYARMMARITKCRAAFAGTEAWRGLDRAVLPQLEGESDASYEVRKACAALHPGFEKAVDVGVGLLLQKEPTIDAKAPAELLQFYEDVDGAGTHGTLFCDDLCTASMVDGIAGIFTDYTRDDDPTLDRANASAAAIPGTALDAADTRALGLRPYWVLVKADEILKPLYQVIGGVKTLVLFVRKETVERIIEPYGVQTLTRYRAYRLRGKVVSCQLFEQTSEGAEPQKVGPEIMLRNQQTIPWSPLRGGQRVSDTETRPTLVGLCDLIEQYHQIWSTTLSCIELSATNTLVRIGAEPDADGVYPPITIGPRGTLECPAIPGVTTPVYWINADASATVPAESALVRTETLMGLASASFLAPDKRSAETEKSKQMAARAGNATLSGFGRRLQDCLELSLLHVARFKGLPTGASVTVNLDFEDALMDANVITAYCKLVEAGYPKRLALEALQTGGRIKPDADLEALEREWDLNLELRAEQAKVDAALANAPLDTPRDTPTDAPTDAPKPATPRRIKLTRGADNRLNGLEVMA